MTRLPGPSLAEHLKFVPAMFGNPYAALMELHGRYGPVSQFGYGGQSYVLMFGAEANKLILTDNPARPRFTCREVLTLLVPVVGERAIVVSDGEDHRRRKALVQPAFAKRRIDSYVPIMIDEIHAMFRRWTPGTRIDAFAEVRSCIRRIAIRGLFGQRLRSQTDEIGRDLEIALHYTNTSPFLRFDHDLPFTPYRKAIRARARVDERVRQEIEMRRAEGGEHGDVLDALLERPCEHAGQDYLDDLEIRDQVISLIASGYDSSSTAAGWAVHALLTHPHVADRIREEVEQVVGDEDLNVEHLAKLDYTGWCVNEILRLYTPGVLTGRTTTTDIEFAGHMIPRGRRVLYSQYVTHRLPELWSDALVFEPERWNRDAPGYREPVPFSFVPFGAGFRRCIGYAFAELELRAMLAELVRRVELTGVPGAHVRPVGVATMWPKDGVPVEVGAVRL